MQILTFEDFIQLMQLKTWSKRKLKETNKQTRTKEKRSFWHFEHFKAIKLRNGIKCLISTHNCYKCFILVHWPLTTIKAPKVVWEADLFKVVSLTDPTICQVCHIKVYCGFPPAFLIISLFVWLDLESEPSNMEPLPKRNPTPAEPSPAEKAQELSMYNHIYM